MLRENTDTALLGEACDTDITDLIEKEGIASQINSYEDFKE
jgi:ACT domain-containing protein